MFGMLCTIIAWIGSKAINSIEAMRDELKGVAWELHDRINGIDRRVTVVETRCDNAHGRRNGDRE